MTVLKHCGNDRDIRFFEQLVGFFTELLLQLDIITRFNPHLH